MKVLVLHGSPRKNRNSDTLARYFLNGLGESREQAIQHFYLNELTISPCQGCLSCETSEDHTCAILDDMQDIYAAFIQADLIVFATPMYWGYLTAQLKTAVDRMEALAWTHFRDKTFIVLITYRFHCESAVAFFERISPHFGIELHVVTCRTWDENLRADIPITDCPEKLNQAYELGVSLR
ncbi:MAG: flavodoxin family protein [Anaerolineales bacterium]|nr:flavodoxin family protein [Anaerolineales bacterium]